MQRDFDLTLPCSATYVQWGLVVAVRGCRGDEGFVLQPESCKILPGASVALRFLIGWSLLWGAVNQ